MGTRLDNVLCGGGGALAVLGWVLTSWVLITAATVVVCGGAVYALIADHSNRAGR